IVTLLYYLENNPEHVIVKSMLEKAVVKKFHEANDHFTKSEFTLLFFDIMSCPYVKFENKKKIMVHSSYLSTGDFEGEIKSIGELQPWFFDWNKDVDLERVLKKKEWASTY